MLYAKWISKYSHITGTFAAGYGGSSSRLSRISDIANAELILTFEARFVSSPRNGISVIAGRRCNRHQHHGMNSAAT